MRESLTREERLAALLASFGAAMGEAAHAMGTELMGNYVRRIGNLTRFSEELQRVREQAVIAEIIRVTGMAEQDARQRLDVLTSFSIAGREVHVVQNRASPPTEIRIGNVRVTDLALSPREQEQVIEAGRQVTQELQSSLVGHVVRHGNVLGWEANDPNEPPAQTATSETPGLDAFLGTEGLSMPEPENRVSFLTAMGRVLRNIRERATVVSGQEAGQFSQGEFLETASIPRRSRAGVRYQTERLSPEPPPGVAMIDEMTDEAAEAAAEALRQRREERTTWAERMEEAVQEFMVSDAGAFLSIDPSGAASSDALDAVRVVRAGNYQEYMDWCQEHHINPHAQGAPLYAGPTREALEALRDYTPHEMITIGTWDQAIRWEMERARLGDPEMPGDMAYAPSSAQVQFLGDLQSIHMPDPEHPGAYIPVGEFRGLGRDNFSNPNQTRWERMRDMAFHKLTALGMDVGIFVEFWHRAQERFASN